MKNCNLKFKNFYFLVVVFSFSFLIFPLVARGATLYLAPQFQTVYQGNTFILEVRLNTEGEEINTAKAHLIFSPDLLKPVDFIKGSSILPFFVGEPKIRKGEIYFTGGVPNGFKGEGLLAKISFLAKKTGKEDINFKENSRILLNDGKGTPAQLKLQGGSYEIVKKPKELPIITSETHPDQNKWYKGASLQLHWDLIKGAKYSWILDRDPLAEPDEIPDKPKPQKGIAFWMGAMKYDLKKEGDGIYYFSLRQKLPGKDWSKEVSRFKAMIDSTPPEDFEPQIGKDPAVFGGRYFLSFAARDKTSGIDHYEVSETPRIAWKRIEKWKMAKSPYLLRDQNLKSIVKVKAVDKAGNERIAKVVLPYKITWEDIVFLLLVLAGIVALWLIIKKFVKPRHKT